MRPHVKRKWTESDMQTLRDQYPHKPSRDVAALLGRPMSSVQKMAQMSGIKKTPETLQKIMADNAKHGIAAGASTRFKPRHGRAGSKTGSYGVWLFMKQRCEYEGHKSFKHYGGRGIVICARWAVYENFHADMGDPPFGGATIGRIDNAGNYDPGNCRWESMVEQNRNRRSNRLVTAWGETQCLEAWAERAGMRSDTLAYRLGRGMAPEDALTKPVASRA